MNIKILDCTLRDGGYINDWNFLDKQILKVINSLEQSKIDTIECGYLDNKKGKSSNSTLFKKNESINTLLSNHDSNFEKVVMINFGDYDTDLLPLQSECEISGIRLAFHKKDLISALEQGEKIIAKGYKLYFQPMVTKNFSDLEFLKMIELVNNLNPYSFYIVDSFGSMTLDEFQKFLIMANNNLNIDISLGYHAHNNMQLAFSNAISMCTSNLKRDIIIDASIYGIGRGSGNLNTELIADYLNTEFAKNYDTLPLLEIIDEFLSSLMSQSPWGFTPAQFLSASFNCHPNYATYLINKNTNHIVGIKKILNKIPFEKRSSFDKNLIENLYNQSILEPKINITKTFSLKTEKKILLIASGKSVNDYLEVLENKIKENYLVIALNHKPSFQCDYYFFTNQKRFDEFSNILELNKTILSDNISTQMNINSIINLSSFAFIQKKLITNIAVVCINFLISQGYKSLEIMGLDGYKIDLDNYNYKETSFITDRKALEEENKILEQSLNVLKEKINIDFITPSIFKDTNSFKIIGVIPARYKSSRFEGKPLCLINSIPMIKRTYEQAKQSILLDELVVATDSDKIKSYCDSENIPVVMTSEDCLTGTDRIAEVSQTKHYDLYVNIQGDEPVIDPLSIDEVISEFKKYGNKYIAYNLYKEIDIDNEINSDTIIKVIVNEEDELMYMSRLGIPFNKSSITPTYKKQVCVYGFTKDALKVFSSSDKTINEQFEDIEILRFLDMGYKVKMKETNVDSIAVDIPEDILKVEQFLKIKGLN